MPQLPLLLLRGAFVLELGGLAYLATFAILNAPAYSQQVRLAANGGDLSADVAGTYLPIEDVPEAPSSKFPYTTVSLEAAGAQRAVAVPTRTAAATATSAAGATSLPTIDPSVFVPNSVTVPRIGARAPIVEIESNTEKRQQAGLAHGVIHLYGTPKAGQDGNAFYAAHSSDFIFKLGEYKTVFSLLPNLHQGDYFIISDDHTMRYFRVVETKVVSPKDTSVLARGGPGNPYATLQTSYPVGTALQRFVAIGKLEKAVDVAQ